MSDNENEVKSISAVEFHKLYLENRGSVTILDLREPDEILVHPLEGTVKVPFSKIGSGLSSIPNDKPVYVICRTGDFSQEVTEILTDRGYIAYNVLGGYDEFIKQSVSDEIYIDAKKLRCPGPIVKVADTLRDLPAGTHVSVEATEDAFYSDIKVWCERTGNKLEELTAADGIIKAKIVKTDLNSSKNENKVLTSEQNDKTFVVFSGDLDKTIAAFIMANGAASLGRNVTMFFTFWGLNILRKPQKVKVAKNFIEKMFGMMMPRGTTRLGLSRMNMFGAGAKMIRAIMKKKGVASLEELIADAISHGVRIVACQMSMDIMGIHKEELIDGVELGGVATFIGSGEKSDMSLFI